MFNSEPEPRSMMLTADTIANTKSLHYPDYPAARIESGNGKARTARRIAGEDGR